MLKAPFTVNEPEPLVPFVKVNPLVVASVSVPCATESATESPPVLTSLIEIALPFLVEKTSDVFSATDSDAGAVIDGADELTVNATLAEPDLPSPESTTEIASVSDPA